MGEEAKVVVRATGTGASYSSSCDEYRFETGDVGLLMLRECSVPIRVFEPWVLWDKDATHVPRRTFLEQVEIIGLEWNQMRLVCKRL
jgi:hypothetical protein